MHDHESIPTHDSIFSLERIWKLVKPTWYQWQPFLTANCWSN